MPKPAILHYSHHSVGLGHLVRSLAVAAGLTERFRVVLCSGGPVPAGLRLPDGVEIVELPPIGAGPDGPLASLDPALTLERAFELRQAQLLEQYARLRPVAIVVELFPFGRAKFARELLPLLDRARRDPRAVLVVASVRDLLVTAKRDQEAHDDLAAERLRRYFDAVIVHADARFARLEETFRRPVPASTALFYSGFVAPGEQPLRRAPRTPREIVVSAGGGLHGAELLHAGAGAHRVALAAHGFRTRLLTGPFLPAADVDALKRGAAGCDGLTVERFVPDLAATLAGAAASVSQCGYNTTLDLLRSRVPAVIVPYDGERENEQSERAGRLARLGIATVLPAAELGPDRLAEAVLTAIEAPAGSVELDLAGATKTAGFISQLVEFRSRVGAAA